MASTAWTIQIRMLTASTAPKMFGNLAREAKAAGVAVETGQKHLKTFGETAGKVRPQIAGAATATRALARAMGMLPQNAAAANRSLGGLARSTRVVSAAASSNLGQVNSSLNIVRATANAAAASVRGLASAVRTVRPVRTGVNVNAGSGSGGMSPATLGAAAGGALAGGMLYGSVQQASLLQGTTLQAAIGSGRMGRNLAQSTYNMRDMRDIAFKMSTMTGQSLPDSMGVIASMASAGVSPQQLKSIYKPIAQFTDILHFGKDKMDYGESAKLGAGLVHDLRFFTPEDTAYGLGRIAQLGYLSPHGTNQIATQIRRFAPTFENILPGDNRQKATTITEMAAWTDRMGNLPFAGSALSQMVTQMIAPRSERVARSLETLGIYTHGHYQGKKYIPGTNRYFDEHTGRFDVMGALHRVATTYGNAKDKGPIVTALLGNTQNAARIMQALSSPEALKAYDRIVKQRRAMGDDPVAWMNNVQTQLMSQLSTQTQRLTSDFKSLQSVLGDRLLPQLTPFVKNLADATEALTKFLDKHPRVASAGVAALAGTALAGGAAALYLGGYVAHGAFKPLLKLLGNHALEHGVAETASETVRHRGALGLLAAGGTFAAAGGARLGRAAYRFTGLGAITSIGKFADEIALVSARAGGARMGLGGLVAVLAKLGLRGIPVVGEILMLADSIRFLGAHAKDIGYGLGYAARWLTDKGGPMLRDALIAAIKSAFVGALSSLPKSPAEWAKYVATTAAQGGPLGFGLSVGRGIVHFGQGVGAGWNAAGGGSQGNVVPMVPRHVRGAGGHVAMATGGRVLGDGLAFLHKNEVVVNDRLTRRLERITDERHGGNSLGTRTHRIVLASEGGSMAGMSEREKREFARMIAGYLGEDVELDVRSGGATPQITGSSTYSVIQGSSVA